MKRQFDKFAEDYREIHTENVLKVSGADSDYFTEYKIAEISKFINNGKVWLDFGCGDGNSARFILKYFPQSQYYGVYHFWLRRHWKDSAGVPGSGQCLLLCR